jgi:hypothetical protein
MGRPRLKPTVGAQLSEILNEELESKESGFSRRRVVKGVAWSVPVIITAVASPAAAASPPTVSMSFDASVTKKNSILQLNASGKSNARDGSVPAKLIVENAPSGLSGSIIIAAADTTPAKSWIGPKTLGSGSSANLQSTTWGADRTSTTPFTLTGGASTDYPVTFQYRDEGTPAKGVFSYLVTVQVGTSILARTTLKMTI